MKKSNLFIGVLAGSMFIGSAFAREVKDVVSEVVAAAANATVVAAVKEQNALGVSSSKIQEMDKRWMAEKGASSFKDSIQSNAAAKALANIEKSKPYLVEFILTDNQGANVAITGMTSDYWQGDEPKFTNAYADGKGDTYIARPQKDKSTGEVISQISVPVLNNGKAIGTLTVGVRTEKLK